MLNSIQKGIEFLISEQEAGGAFVSFSSPDPFSFAEKDVQYHSTFALSMILHSSKRLVEYDKRVKNMRENLANLLLKEKSSHYSFNYWQRDSEEYKKLPYPDDLDDTCSALAALHSYNPDIIDGSALAAVSRLLITNEIQEGGPYRTWLLSSEVDRKQWNDFDLAVNINIAYFLSLCGIDLPNLSAFIDTHIVSGIFNSAYYPGPYQVLYFLSRFYKGQHTSRLRTYLRHLYYNDVTKRHSLDNALLFSAMLNQRVSMPESKLVAEGLKRSQLPDGSWPAFGFCMDPAIEGERHYSGSPALSTVFCLEALCFYQSEIQRHSYSVSKTQAVSNRTSSVRCRILKKLSDQRAALSEILLSPFDSVMNRMVELDASYPISSLPFMFAERNDYLEDIGLGTLEDLGLASLYGWAAYTAFDDCFDDNAKVTMPVGIYCFRKMQALFLSLMKNMPFFISLMDTILGRAEQALEWEISKARAGELSISIPEYAGRMILADRSLGHALGILAVLYLKGFVTDSLTAKLMLHFFEQHLIARQLCDDMHDIEEDLNNGRLSFVLVDTLLHLDVEARIDLKSLKKLKKDILEMFWNERITAVVDIALFHIEEACHALSELRKSHDVSIFEPLISRDKVLLIEAKKESHAIHTFFRYFNGLSIPLTVGD